MRVPSPLVTVLLAVLSSGAANAGDQLPLFVHVVDCARAMPSDMSVAEHTMTQAFGAASVAARWREGGVAPVDAANHVTVVILTGEMAARKAAADGLPANALGSALPSARRAWIFLDRITQVAWHHQISIGSVLGVVIAHEVAHVTGVIAHSPNGIMRRDLQTTDGFAGGFTEEQGRQIRIALRRPDRNGEPAVTLAKR